MKNYQKKMTEVALMGMMALVPTRATYALSQDETVYAKLGSDGAVYETSVVEHLKNDKKDYQLFDQTTLRDIENLNGFESFRVEGGKVVWDADGKDIYYSGKSQEELPVQMTVTYRMNGEVKTLDEIMGKSGSFEIRYKFKNLSKVGDMYTPFVAALATTFKEGAVSGLEVSNGKVESNGRTLAVAAVAAPGLYESLGIEELKDSDEIVLKFETEKFEMGDVYTVVTPKLLDSEDLKVFAELDALSESASVLADSSKQLVNGSASLNAGLSELQAGILTAKQQVGAVATNIDNATMTQIKNVAAAGAEQAVEAKRAEIAAGIDTQLASSAELQSALHLQAEALCAQMASGAACAEVQVQTVEAQLVAGLKNQLVESSMMLAKQTARETASATAEQIATQVASTIQAKVAPAIGGALDTILGGVDRLVQGAGELNAGMTKFDQEGIQPLANFVNGTIKVTAKKVEQLVKLSEDYQSYAGIADNTEGETKFVLMIEGRKAE